MADIYHQARGDPGRPGGFRRGVRARRRGHREVGIVVDAADGIAQVEGLPGAMANELLRFEDGTLGLALNLDDREIGVVILGDFAGIEEGQPVRRTGEVLSVPSATATSAASSTRSAADRRPGRDRDRGPRALELRRPA